MDDQGEAELIRLALNGDEKAFEMLVVGYERIVYSAAYRMVSNSEDAKDLTQTVFLKVYRNLGSYDPRHRFFSWIYRITINETLNFLRQRRPKQELDETLASSTAGPDEDAHGDQLRDSIQDALRDLTEDYRQVIMLRHFLNRSHQEMSELLGIPEKTVKSRLYSARQLLAKALRRRGVVSA